jgi:hypothetical protein
MRTTIRYQHRAPKWGHIHRSVGSLAILCLLLCASCAQVPKQSVELSATVGRDIAQVHKAHRDLAVILYGRIKNDINRFVDEVYAPYQIKNLLQAEHEDFMKGDPNSLFSALDAAIKQPNRPDVQKAALDVIDVFVQVVRAEVESYRKERLAPILTQEKEVLSAIDRSYNQIHYANSIVTGHLASIVRVHDAQEELLNEFGIEGLRKEIGKKLASTSNNVAEFVEKTSGVDGTIAEMEEISELTKELDMLLRGQEQKEE